ncbi:protein fam71e2-like [Limosa lapponica baueri]|uniref:Protein fam71e2-like n=1 Tax=Limosa lapponica baueri TaxID=1758121 RepID=A0A2I0U086_LIMLA|nr:protein fam71e2-like [Limosa lapponica baueri]
MVASHPSATPQQFGGSRASPVHLLHWLGEEHLLLPSPSTHRGYQGNLFKKKKKKKKSEKPTGLSETLRMGSHGRGGGRRRRGGRRRGGRRRRKKKKKRRRRMKKKKKRRRGGGRRLGKKKKRKRKRRRKRRRRRRRGECLVKIRCTLVQPKKQEASVAASRFLPPLESQDIPRVEEETRGQWSNPKWYQWRENRITASVAPRIANSKFANGRTEEVPRSYLSAVVDDCGLFIHREKEWIAASPDGIVKEAATGKALGLLEVDGDSYALKKNHAYFTQETAVVPVEFDAKFWGQTVPKLEKFYTEAVIPHLEEKAGGSAWAKEE